MKRIITVKADEVDGETFERDFVGVGETLEECKADALWLAEQVWGDDLNFEASEFDNDVLPEGLTPWRGKPGEIEILDAQGHPWVTLHAGANGDPIKWRNTITTAVFTALGIDPREIAK